MEYNYRVKPINPNEIDLPLVKDLELYTEYKEETTTFLTKGIVKVGCLGCSGIFVLFFIYLTFLGVQQGQNSSTILGTLFYFIIFSLPILGFIIYSINKKKKNKQYKANFNKRALQKRESDIKERALLQRKLSLEQAEKTSQELNRILKYSSEIREKFLPFYLKEINNSIQQSQFEFENKGYNPFWEKMEETLIHFNTYNYLSKTLNQNKELYNDLVYNVDSNFPKPFPITDFPHGEVKILLKTFEDIKYKALRNNIDFTHTYNQIKLQNINIKGFNSLESAINNMSRTISNSITELEMSLSNSLNNIIRNQELTYDLLNSKSSNIELNLNEINDRLYNMHHKVKPLWPYIPR